jgi:hypothetical protein
VDLEKPGKNCRSGCFARFFGRERATFCSAKSSQKVGFGGSFGEEICKKAPTTGSKEPEFQAQIAVD